MKSSKWLEAAAVLAIIVSFYLFILRRLKYELREEIAEATKIIRRAHKFAVKDTIASEVGRRRLADCSLAKRTAAPTKSLKLKVLFGKISELKTYVRPELNFGVWYHREHQSIEIAASDLQLYINASVYYRSRLVLLSYFRKRKKCLALQLSHKGEILAESEDSYLIFTMLVRFLLSHFPPEELLREEHLPPGEGCPPQDA